MGLVDTAMMIVAPALPVQSRGEAQALARGTKLHHCLVVQLFARISVVFM
jgi:hypothetical protein